MKVIRESLYLDDRLVSTTIINDDDQGRQYSSVSEQNVRQSWNPFIRLEIEILEVVERRTVVPDCPDDKDELIKACKG